MTDIAVNAIDNAIQENALKSGKFYNVKIDDSKDVHLGSEVQYYGPMKVEQYVTGLPAELANRPEVGQELAKAGLLAATSAAIDPSSPQTVTLLLPDVNQPKDQHCWWWVLGCGGMMLIVLACVLFMALSFTSTVIVSQPSEEAYNPFLPTPDQNVTLSGKLYILDRREWLAQPKNHTKVISTVKYVLITETGGDNCTTNARCKYQIKNAQKQDLQHNLEDIAPNFLLGGDGYGYEGRNWDTPNQCSLNKTYDSDSICISFVGDFTTLRPSDKQLLAAKQLIDESIVLEKLVKNYVVFGVRQINSNIDRPAQTLFDVIKTWPNWKKTTSLFNYY